MTVGTAAAQQPSFEVEATVSALVVPKLEQWLGDLEEAIPRVLADADAEAIHDLRVALRRMRSLLRAVSKVFGRYHVELIRREMSNVAQATGALRDEEVLSETFENLELDASVVQRIKPWRKRRSQREKALRNAVIRQLRAGVLVDPVKHLRALVILPCNPKREREVHQFARRLVLRTQQEVEQLRGASPDSAEAMHDLRIAYKRLRYAIEAFGPALPPELRAWQPVATRFQKVLGNLHDRDVAIEVIKRATSMAPSDRAVVLEALRAERAKIATKYTEFSEAVQPT